MTYCNGIDSKLLEPKETLWVSISLKQLSVLCLFVLPVVWVKIWKKLLRVINNIDHNLVLLPDVLVANGMSTPSANILFKILSKRGAVSRIIALCLPALNFSLELARCYKLRKRLCTRPLFVLSTRALPRRYWTPHD